jgi:hypothetical protein
MMKHCFFEKKKQKTSAPLARARVTTCAPRSKVFLLLFFQKKQRFLPFPESLL